jgi:hypothetical protein
MMSRDRAVHCYRDASGLSWRIQCNAATKICLYAPNEELDASGRRGKPLERAKPCPIFEKQALDRPTLEAEGFSFIPGRADAPHGWTRDNRGRVFQVNFDLKRRLYLGASYAPSKRIRGLTMHKRSSADFGLFVFETYGGKGTPNRHRVRLVEGEVFLEPFSAEIVMAHYDLSRRFLEPLLRFTTFLGPPSRHDLHLNIGLWAEAGHLEVHHADAARSSLWRFGTCQATLDLWQSPRLDSFARVRTGVGVERLYTRPTTLEERLAITPSSAFEIDWVVDRKGFHNLRAEVSYETPQYLEPRPLVGRSAKRVRARLRYETILVAINDQPLTLRFDAGTEKRNDIPGVPYDWAFVANAGLRFSLWAPPRPPG